MVSANEFLLAVEQVVLKKPNPEQRECIKFPLDPALMIVAGPGSGKTTVLVLRALKHVIVDRKLPENIVITTFTRKAAREIRGRLIDWGIPLIEHYKAEAAKANDKEFQSFLSGADVNLFVTGTLDSLCEQWMQVSRKPGEVPPVMLEEFAALQIFNRRIFGQIYDRHEAEIDAYLSQFTFEGDPPESRGEALSIAKQILDRLVQDSVDLQAFRNKVDASQPVRIMLADALEAMHEKFRADAQYDYALLEARLLDSLQQDDAYARMPSIHALLVDEYQDTNPLQEQIYLELARRSGASMTVVGDDDQSLYRFRGATVELFRDFVDRYQNFTHRAEPTLKYLYRNYRSTPEIVTFFNQFIQNDQRFQGARVQPPKPLIKESKNSVGIRVLGMFRQDKETLATDLTEFLDDVFRKDGFVVGNPPVRIKKEERHGNFGDAVYIAHSVNEFGKPFRGNPPSQRFPHLLRTELEQRGISVFNPRGRALKDIQNVQILLGLVSNCIDKDGALYSDMLIKRDVKNQIQLWRQKAASFVQTRPQPDKPNSPTGLLEFVSEWANNAGGRKDWPGEWPVLDLLYKLITWLPDFHDDPEHQIYWEAMTRAITTSVSFSPYKGRILNDVTHAKRSREAIIRDILAPIAENMVEVDEELLTHIPRDRVNFMTIHQIKGLEFPLVIVDVGSDFKIDNHKQRFKRFPEKPSNVVNMESALQDFCEVGPLRVVREDMERTFEDLVRLHYVAYSRPETVLLLIGLNKCLEYQTKIKHVGLFWRMDQTWPWKLPYSGKRPPATVNGHPLIEI